MDQELIDALNAAHIGLDEPNVAQALAQREPVQIADLKEAAVLGRERNHPARWFPRAVGSAAAARRRTSSECSWSAAVRPAASRGTPIDLIKTFAAQSAVAIENARLFQNVETSLEDLRTTQDRLVQTQKLASLGQLTAGIAHEIKNPLNFVNNFSGVSTELIDELREALGRVRAMIRRALKSLN